MRTCLSIAGVLTLLFAPLTASCGAQDPTRALPDAAEAPAVTEESSSSAPGQEAAGAEATANEMEAAEPEASAETVAQNTEMQDSQPAGDATPNREVATLGAGCFWCVEAVLEQVDGIHEVVSGYMGGGPVAPTYKEVCTGRTDFVEVVQVNFDPQVISYSEVLDWFWRLHDPTTLNRQGNDVGPQYRSVIFTHSDAQVETAAKSIQEANASGAFRRPIVTAVEPADVFHVAEAYHQDYYRGNKAQGYCRMVIAPKLKKLELDF